MITVTFCNMTFTCDKAIKGSDYIHLVDADGKLTACFEGVSDFNKFAITGGFWTAAPSNDDCELAVVGAGGVIRKSTKKASDIASLQTDVSGIKNTIAALANRNWKLLYTGNAAPGDTIAVPGSTNYNVFAVMFNTNFKSGTGVAIAARKHNTDYVEGSGTWTFTDTPTADNPSNYTYLYMKQYGCCFYTTDDTWRIDDSASITSKVLYSYSDPNQSTIYSDGPSNILAIYGIV